MKTALSIVLHGVKFFKMKAVIYIHVLRANLKGRCIPPKKEENHLIGKNFFPFWREKPNE